MLIRSLGDAAADHFGSNSGAVVASAACARKRRRERACIEGIHCLITAGCIRIHTPKEVWAKLVIRTTRPEMNRGQQVHCSKVLNQTQFVSTLRRLASPRLEHSWFWRRHFSTAIISVLFSLNAQAEWQNSLKPVGEPTKRPLLLVQSGKPIAEILCPVGATTNITLAALELQKWIAEITGAKLRINCGRASGRNILLRLDPSLGEDGYSLRTEDTQVLLCGGTKRGLMNGVFVLGNRMESMV